MAHTRVIEVLSKSDEKLSIRFIDSKYYEEQDLDKIKSFQEEYNDNDWQVGELYLISRNPELKYKIHQLTKTEIEQLPEMQQDLFFTEKDYYEEKKSILRKNLLADTKYAKRYKETHDPISFIKMMAKRLQNPYASDPFWRRATELTSWLISKYSQEKI